jgi:hypothetical protein
LQLGEERNPNNLKFEVKGAMETVKVRQLRKFKELLENGFYIFIFLLESEP